VLRLNLPRIALLCHRPNLRFSVRNLSEHKSPSVVAEAIVDFIKTSPIADGGRATGIVYW
jgi:hypothetical protein